MEVSAEKFNSFSGQMNKHAQFLIEKIKSKEGQREFNLVLDIGSGSGSMTVVLSENINCKKLIGLDVDDQMIEFAKQNHKRDNIDYFQCNVQLPWDQLSDEVKQLEGKCSLIYSSVVFHWITDINQCCANLRRFLAPDGKIYANMLPLDGLPSYRLSGEAKELEKVIPLLKPGNFTNTWKLALNDSGLRLEVAEEVWRNYIYPKDFIDKFIGSVAYTLLMKHAKGDDEARKIVDKYKDWLSISAYNNMTIDDQQQYRYELTYLFIVAKK